LLFSRSELKGFFFNIIKKIRIRVDLAFISFYFGCFVIAQLIDYNVRLFFDDISLFIFIIIKEISIGVDGFFGMITIVGHIFVLVIAFDNVSGFTFLPIIMMVPIGWHCVFFSEI